MQNFYMETRNQKQGTKPKTCSGTSMQSEFYVKHDNQIVKVVQIQAFKDDEGRLRVITRLNDVEGKLKSVNEIIVE